jgi:hypothetical protein
VRLSSHYHLGCDYGTAVMVSWENRGIAPIYLCESHAAQLGWSSKISEGVVAMSPQSVRTNHPAKDDGQTQTIEVAAGTRPKRPVPSGSAADSQVGIGKEDLAVPRVPVRDPTSGDSAKASANEAIGEVGNLDREDFKAFGPALQGGEPSATGEKQAESVTLERLCLSRYGQRCACEAVVHCPKCGRWFCDAHGEDEKWHACALMI